MAKNKNRKGTKHYICAAPQVSPLIKTEFEALTWVEISNVGSKGETGVNTNMTSYNPIDEVVTQHDKGNTSAGTPDMEVARNGADAGQVILRAAGVPDNQFEYATKEVRNDMPSGGTSGTTFYNCGVVAGPKRPNGGGEDYDLEVFTLGNNQIEVVVEAV